jgi:hypothetical protein
METVVLLQKRGAPGTLKNGYNKKKTRNKKEYFMIMEVPARLEGFFVFDSLISR